MAFETREDVLLHFMDGGDMLDRESGMVYVADVAGGGRFYGIMVGDPVPEELRGDIDAAVEYALDHYPAPGCGTGDRFQFMEAPGAWFGWLAELVVGHPERFAARTSE